MSTSEKEVTKRLAEWVCESEFRAVGFPTTCAAKRPRARCSTGWAARWAARATTAHPWTSRYGL